MLEERSVSNDVEGPLESKLRGIRGAGERKRKTSKDGGMEKGGRREIEERVGQRPWSRNVAPGLNEFH